MRAFSRILSGLALALLGFSAASPALAREDSAPLDLEEAPARDAKIKKIKVKTLSDLSKLSPFEDIAVIQKRFLAKTSRYETGLKLKFIMDSQFFYIGGLTGHLTYFIREKHGAGIMGYYVHHLEKPLSRDLQAAPNKIIPFEHTAPRFFVGAYYRWTPIYGKFAVFNKKIIYFDMFFDVGGGGVHIVSARQGSVWRPALPFSPAGRFSAGQIFAFSKNTGFSWDFSWVGYYYDLKNQADGSARGQFGYDLSVSFGLSWHFPKAGAR